MVRHNNQIPNQHFRKNWAVRVLSDSLRWLHSECSSAQRRCVHSSRLRM